MTVVEPDPTTRTPTTGSPSLEGGLVRVSVRAGERRSDLALPGDLPVAELLPELARLLNLLNAETVYGGYRLVTAEGRALRADSGLFAQDVDSGDVLTLAAGVDDPPPRVYDDIVEAMADTVEADLPAWDPAVGRRTALVSAALVLLLGGVALGLQRSDVIAGATAGVAAAVLVAAAIVLARVRQEHETAVLLAWSGVFFAVVAGLTATPEGPVLGTPAAVAAGGALVVGLVSLLGLPERRAALVPAVAGGAALAIADVVVAVSDFDGASVHCVALVVAVVAGSALPWAALSSTGTRVEQAQSERDLLPDQVEPVDSEVVARNARMGHDVLLAVTVSVGLLLVVVAPLAVSRGITGALLAVAASVVLLLRTRQYRVGSEVVAGLLCGVAGLVAVCLGIVVERPAWLPVLAVVLAVVAVVLLVFTLVPMPASVRWGRLGDVAELVCLVALLPLLVFAIGLVGAVSP